MACYEWFFHIGWKCFYLDSIVIVYYIKYKNQPFNKDLLLISLYITLYTVLIVLFVIVVLLYNN